MTQKVIPPPAVIEALRSSGFPFQTAVTHAVQATPGWRVYASEYSWQTRGETRFLDLVATNGVIYLAIECKKTRKEILTFLRPLSSSTSTGLATAFRCLRAVNMQDSSRRIEIFCETWGLNPRSNVSEFCVVSTSDSGKDQRLLERDAGLLISAVDAFAYGLKYPTRPMPLASLIIPVIVTNAPLYTARYDPRAVSLETGEFKAPPDDITNPECVRFEKSFPSEVIQDLGDRTVFVVNALSFVEFLSLVGPAPHQPAAGGTPVMLDPRR